MENKLKFPLEIQFFAEDTPTDPTEDDENVDLDEVNENEPDEPGDEDGENTDGSEAGETGTDQTHRNRKRDAEMARKRREAEAAAKAKAEQERLLKEARIKGEIQGIGGVNPYTEQPIEDEEDLHEYHIMKELDKKGIEPTLKEVAKALKKERQERAQQTAAEQENERKRNEAASQRMKELQDKYPLADMNWLKNEIESNEKFKELLDHGVAPLRAIEILDIKPPVSKKRSTPNVNNPGEQESGHKKESNEDFKKRYTETYGRW